MRTAIPQIRMMIKFFWISTTSKINYANIVQSVGARRYGTAKRCRSQYPDAHQITSFVANQAGQGGVHYQLNFNFSITFFRFSFIISLSLITTPSKKRKATLGMIGQHLIRRKEQQLYMPEKERRCAD